MSDLSSVLLRHQVLAVVIEYHEVVVVIMIDKYFYGTPLVDSVFGWLTAVVAGVPSALIESPLLPAEVQHGPIVQ